MATETLGGAASLEVVEPFAQDRRLLRQDLRRAAETLTLPEVRYLVDLYYQWQGFRVAAGHQSRIMALGDEPHETIAWAGQRLWTLERDVFAILDGYSAGEPTGMGQWARAICGVGPVLASGLLAHIDITRAPTVGHIWRLAGLDPTQQWLGKTGATALVQEVLAARRTVTVDDIAQLAQRAGRRADVLERGGTNEHGWVDRTQLQKFLARRPWNASLKVLCFKLGESFIKVQHNPADEYGRYYVARKALEQARNAQGEYASQAARKLQQQRIGRDTDAYRAYSQGRLPPAHIHARARRWAVKLFLAHYWEEAYVRHYSRPPALPYPISRLGHDPTHYIPRPRPTGDGQGSAVRG